MQCCPAVSQSPSLPWQQADTCALHPRFTEVDMALAKRPAERGSSNDPRPRCLLPTALAWLAMRASTCLESGAAHHHWECHLERPQRLVVCGPLLCDVLLPLLRCRRSKSSSVKCGAKGAERSLERNDRRQRSLISSSLHSQMARVASREPKSRLIILRAEAGGGRTVGCGAVVGLERRQRRRYGGAVGVTALTVVAVEAAAATTAGDCVGFGVAAGFPAFGARLSVAGACRIAAGDLPRFFASRRASCRSSRTARACCGCYRP
jgi:hypothetical protein